MKCALRRLSFAGQEMHARHVLFIFCYLCCIEGEGLNGSFGRSAGPLIYSQPVYLNKPTASGLQDCAELAKVWISQRTLAPFKIIAVRPSKSSYMP